MDMQALHTPIIFMGIFVLASLVLFLVYKFGIQEKSYEEALAEQRKINQNIIGTKPKPKEKKGKKPNKKSKEEKKLPDRDTSPESERNNDNSEEAHPKPHVEFKEVAEEVTDASSAANKKKSKQVKSKPILINKEKSTTESVESLPVVNHFEELHPKDDAELRRSTSRDNLIVKESSKEKVALTKSSGSTEGKKKPKFSPETAPAIVEKTDKKADKIEKVNNVKEKEEKPGKVNLVKEKEEKPVEKVVAPPSNGYVVNTGKEKKKKKSEYNALQQLSEKEGASLSTLLNMVRNAELTRSDVQILIDLLLNKQHEAPAVIDEWTEGRFDPVQRLKKQLAEKEKSLIETQEALDAMQAKLKEVRTEQLSEKSQLQQKLRGLEEMLQAKQIEIQANNNRYSAQVQSLQNLQVQLNEEAMKTHAMREELTALRMQKQQFDMLCAQKAESDQIIMTLTGKVQEVTAINEKLMIDMQGAGENAAQKEQMYIVQINNIKKDLEQKARQIEMALRQENELKSELSQLRAKVKEQSEEIKKNQLYNSQAQEQIRNLQKQKDDSSKLANQLKVDLQNLQESQTNGSVEEKKAHQVEILNLHNELSSIKSLLQQKESTFNKELETSSQAVSQLRTELEQQKAKNNELRTKNWKVMEALNIAESKIKTNHGKPQGADLDKIISDIRSEEQASQKEFLKRLFPDIRNLDNVAPSNWQEECGKLIQNHLSELKSSQREKPSQSSPEKTQDVAKLQAQILHYKSIIDDTEGSLKKLQEHIESEELQWRTQLSAKEQEVESFRNQISQLTSALSNLEKQLALTQGGSLKGLKNSGSDFASLEKFKEEENHHLSSQTENGNL